MFCVTQVLEQVLYYCDFYKYINKICNYKQQYTWHNNILETSCETNKTLKIVKRHVKNNKRIYYHTRQHYGPHTILIHDIHVRHHNPITLMQSNEDKLSISIPDIVNNRLIFVSFSNSVWKFLPIHFIGEYYGPDCNIYNSVMQVEKTANKIIISYYMNTYLLPQLYSDMHDETCRKITNLTNTYLIRFPSASGSSHINEVFELGITRQYYSYICPKEFLCVSHRFERTLD
jgi:hypothetical protein